MGLKCGIYSITNLSNGKKYIGQARDIEDRWKNHIWKLNTNKHCNKYLQNAWSKYGQDNFKFEIICLCTEDKLNDLEIQFISTYNSFCKGNGYNLTLGGEGTTGHKLSEEAKQIIGQAQKGKTISQEQRDNLSQQFSGSGNPFYGLKHTEETKEKISEYRKLKECSKGGNNCKAKKVICNNIVYDCATDCANYYKIKSCTLRSWIRGDRPMPQNFIDMELRFI